MLLQGVNCLSPQGDFLLFEVSPVLFIDQHQVEEESNRKAVVDVAHGRHKWKARQEQAHRDGFSADWCSIHNFKLAEGFVLCHPLPCLLALDNRKLHVLNFDAHQQEVNLADDNIVQVVLGLVVLELNVEAILDAHFHFDAVVDLWHNTRVLHHKVAVLYNIRRVILRHSHTDEIAQPHVQAVVRLVLFVCVGEVELELLLAGDGARRTQLLHAVQELLAVASVVQNLNNPKQLCLHTNVVHRLARLDDDRARHIFFPAVHGEVDRLHPFL